MVELKLSVPVERLDDLEQQLLELGDGRWMVTEDLPTKSATLVGVFENAAVARQAWDDLARALPAELLPSDPQHRDLRDEDWRDSYKAHFHAWKFGPLHWVPIWQRDTYILPAEEGAIWLDPGLAFGTGNHETTRLCCERLVTWAGSAPRSARVVDAGCGSGILALSAVRLGFTSVRGFDNDPEAVRVSRENAALNDLSGRVNFGVGDLVTGLEPACADLLLANIQSDVLLRFAEPLINAVAADGTLVLSGILASEIEEVRRVFAQRIPKGPIETRILNEWADLKWPRVP